MRDLIERFYARAWNSWDDAAVTGLLDERFVFRGSLGDEVTGRNGFRGYRDKVRAAFPDFHNEILDLVIEGDRAPVRLRSTGHHRGGILGFPATGTLVILRRVGASDTRPPQRTAVFEVGDTSVDLVGGTSRYPVTSCPIS